MKNIVIAALAACTALAAAAQPRDEDAHAAYRRGYDQGFESGYRKGLEEGERRARAQNSPAPSMGPIHVTGAVYGSSAHRCDATRYASRRANGKMSYSFEVTNEMCGDPSPGDRKSLDVTYRCGGAMKTASANEHRTVYLDCRP